MINHKEAAERISETLNRVHPKLNGALQAFHSGQVSRREFIRFSTLLGLSAGFATACTTGTEDDELDSTLSDAQLVPDAGPVQGGILRIGFTYASIGHPAQISWITPANMVRQVAEYLTYTDQNNFVHPFLLKQWRTNMGFDEWRLYLHDDVTFNDGRPLTLDDLMANFQTWLDPEIGSSMLALLKYVDGMESLSKDEDEDGQFLRVSLSSPNIGLADTLFHYPAAILPSDFGGDFESDPIGTGPFTLAVPFDGEKIIFRARPDYWRKDDSGNQLPYLDEIQYIQMPRDRYAEALINNEIDMVDNPGPEHWQQLNGISGIRIANVSSSQTLVLRVRVDEGPPWDSPLVRKALRKVQNRSMILNATWFGHGDLGIDAHIAPVHQAYAPQPIPEYDPAGARELLEEWAQETGNELPIRATIVTKNDDGEAEFARMIQADAESVGFEFDLDIRDPSGYWGVWNEVSVGITSWTHRSLETILLPLAYTADADGNPVPWNETRWVDAQFDSVLKQAEGTSDVTRRRELIETLISIFQERGPIGVPFFKTIWRIYRAEFFNVISHPASFDIFTEVWKRERDNL